MTIVKRFTMTAILACGTAFAAQAATLPADWTVVGNAGIGGANGVVTAPSATDSGYYYVSTFGGPQGGGQLPGLGGTNGSTVTTGAFAAAAGDALEFLFNYVTSDGAGYADYGWARVIDAVSNSQVALLFTARTTPGGDTVPGFGMPQPEATMVPADTPIIPGGPVWDVLGSDSGNCYDLGCGYTGWIKSTYQFQNDGLYQLQFGVSNWSDTSWHSGMAFSGAIVGNVVITPPVDPSPVPLPASALLLAGGVAAMGALRRRRGA
ncbi:MAG: NF038132 family protein [Paracoccus sp. (in: a-proteobacteria)]|nr:NF038132 family protein [Paracoccus sp. (in: a-proteobacteria)]